MWRPKKEPRNHRGFAADRVSFPCNTCPQNRGVPTEADARYLVMSQCDKGGMERCHNCGQELVEIDNRGERLTGCLSCNLWAREARRDG